MKSLKMKYIAIAIACISIIACQKKDYSADPARVATISNLQYQLNGDTVVITWDLPSGAYVYPLINTGSGATKLALNATSYKFGIVETNKDYGVTIKLADTSGNLSLGETVRFNRAGASPVSNLSALQDEKDVVVSWTAPATAVSKIQIKFGSQTVEVAPTATSYRFTNMALGAYTVSAITTNSSNQPSNTVYLTFRVGATAVAYIGIYSDSTSLLNTGDDDEVAAAKWLFSQYASARYISFDQIKNGSVDLSQYRVLWWNYDLESTKNLPAIALDATVLNKIGTFYKNGGGLLLNQFAVQYFWNVGRFTLPYFTEYGTGAGFNNPDAWGIGINIRQKHNYSNHPLYKNINLTTQGDGRVTFPTIGPGWKENHNAVIIRIPEYYGLPNDSDDAFARFNADNNTLWLGMWDGIGDYFMAGIIELQPKDSFQGTGIFIGIGGIEWNQNGTTNPYQDNVKNLYKNAIEYLKTK